MDDLELAKHIYDDHAHTLPLCFEKAPDVTWAQVHKLVHDLARKRGEPVHGPFDGYRYWKGGS